MCIHTDSHTRPDSFPRVFTKWAESPVLCRRSLSSVRFGVISICVTPGSQLTLPQPFSVAPVCVLRLRVCFHPAGELLVVGIRRLCTQWGRLRLSRPSLGVPIPGCTCGAAAGTAPPSSAEQRHRTRAAAWPFPRLPRAAACPLHALGCCAQR